MCLSLGPMQQEMATRELKRSMLRTSVMYSEEDDTDNGSEVGLRWKPRPFPYTVGGEHLFHQQVSGQVQGATVFTASHSSSFSVF